jgi:microcystin-dependent protein
MAEPYIGEIRLCSFKFAPSKWALCDGSLLQISDYQSLYAIIGTTYGGDGQTTFALPNLLGRLPICMATPKDIGAIAGAETVTLNSTTTPTHTHILTATTDAANSSSPRDALLGTTTVNVYNAPVAMAQMTSATDPGPGYDFPHSNLMPFLCINYVIALDGIFPVQN